MVLVSLELGPTKVAGPIGQHRHWQALPMEQSERVKAEHRPIQRMQEWVLPSCWLLQELLFPKR